MFVTALLETIEQNGKPPSEENSCGDNGETGVRHRSQAAEANTSGESATDSAKPYTSEQLDAVKRCFCLLHFRCC